MIDYVIGDALDGGGYRVIPHVCNDRGVWGAGFVLSLSRRWTRPEQVYKAGYEYGKINLGYVQLVGVDKNICVANMVAQTLDKEPVRVKYDHLQDCLRKVALLVNTLRESSGKPWQVHMPRIGVGLGGGSWDRVEPLIISELVQAGLTVKVFDFPGNLAPTLTQGTLET